MRNLRECTSSQLNSGKLHCMPNMNRVKGSIVVPVGTKLPKGLTADKLEELAHADKSLRINGIFKYVEYAKEGGEVQTSTVGYGGEEVTGVSAQKDTFTLAEFNPVLHASFMRCLNQQFGVYHFDDENKLFGLNDGTDLLAPVPVTIYSNATPYNTSSAKPTMTVSYCIEDAKQVGIDWDFEKLDFNPADLTLGLVPVRLEKTEGNGNEYKLYEDKGAFDLTSQYGPLLAEAGETVIAGTEVTAVAYNADKNVITITASEVTGLKAPSVLYTSGITGIESV